jgi:hypothetical protein
MNIQTESLLTKVKPSTPWPFYNYIRGDLNSVPWVYKVKLLRVITIVSLLFVWQISGETASSTVNTGSLSDLCNIANASLYGFEDYHGVDIGVVRAIRLWYAPMGGEFSIEIKLKDDDTKLGFAISRTEEVSLYGSLLHAINHWHRHKHQTQHW